MKLYDDYYKAREAFYKIYETLEKRYHVNLITHEICEDLTLEVLEIIPNIKGKLVCITSGLHGIEGYVGTMVIEDFVNSMLGDIDLEKTHVILVHSINPFGMKYFRKTNENNVDLNRSFVTDMENSRKAFDNKYIENNAYYFKPRNLVNNLFVEDVKFISRTIRLFTTTSISEFKESALIGQYTYDNMFCFGGFNRQKSTSIMMKLYSQLMKEDYKNRIFIDLHTGYGPKYQMSMVHSVYEKRSQKQLEKDFQYPLIEKADGDSFYEIHGDMTDYQYSLLYKKDYAVCFEFGTIGESSISELKSLNFMLQENSIYHHHDEGDKIYQKVKDRIKKLYCPNDEKWLKKVIVDYREAMNGIFKYYGI